MLVRGKVWSLPSSLRSGLDDKDCGRGHDCLWLLDTVDITSLFADVSDKEVENVHSSFDTLTKRKKKGFSYNIHTIAKIF